MKWPKRRNRQAEAFEALGNALRGMVKIPDILTIRPDFGKRETITVDVQVFDPTGNLVGNQRHALTQRMDGSFYGLELPTIDIPGSDYRMPPSRVRISVR